MTLINARGRPDLRWSSSVNDAASVQCARLDFGAFLQRRGVQEPWLADCMVIFGELTSNAVRHAGGTVSVRVLSDAGHLVLCVTDRAGNANLHIAPFNAKSESGRGLGIVRALAGPLWSERSEGKKTVCATLPCSPPRSVSRGGCASA